MTTAARSLCVKVDVDTLEGYLKGVPRLLALLSARGIRATFCVPTGPDHSGRAVKRVFTHRGFISKMLRTRAASMYGLKTMLYGTLLPGPLIIAANPRLLNEIHSAGHELLPHGWDHVAWHDGLARWNMERTRAELRRACEGMESLTGQPCHAFAAPGWQATGNSLRAQEELGLQYSSDTRGPCPFFPLVEGRAVKVLQIPTTLPTLDELIGRPDLERADLTEHILGLIRQSPGPHVFTIHAEAEGRAWSDWFEDLLRRLLQEHVEFIILGQLCERALAAQPVPHSEVILAELPGRAGRVACQASSHPTT